MSAARRWWGLAAKLALSALLLAWLLSSHLSVTEIRGALAAPRWAWLLGALVVYGLSTLGGTLQWLWILRAAGVTAPAGELHRLYQVGLFFNNFLPANVGGDAVKIFDLGRQEGRPLKIFCATVLDRLIGLTGLTLLALVGGRADRRADRRTADGLPAARGAAGLARPAGADAVAAGLLAPAASAAASARRPAPLPAWRRRWASSRSTGRGCAGSWACSSSPWSCRRCAWSPT